MAGKKAPPPAVTNEPVAVTQPAASWSRKIPVISEAPSRSPKPRSDHQARSRRRPNPEKGRPSRERPQTQTLAAATRAAPVYSREGGGRREAAERAGAGREGKA